MALGASRLLRAKIFLLILWQGGAHARVKRNCGGAWTEHPVDLSFTSVFLKLKTAVWNLRAHIGSWVMAFPEVW